MYELVLSFGLNAWTYYEHHKIFFVSVELNVDAVQHEFKYISQPRV